VIQPLLYIPTPLKVKFLTISGNIEDINSIQSLIQKVGPYLEFLELNIYNIIMREKVLESITNHCNRIQFLYLKNINHKNIPQLIKLITNLNHCLKYLTLENNDYYHSDNTVKVSTMMLEGLGQSLLDSLEYLNLYLYFDQNDLQSFLNNYKNDKLKKLLIRNKIINDVHTLNVLMEFVKKKNLEYLFYGVHKYFDNSLDDLIKDIQPYVKIRKYEDLVIKISDYEKSFRD